MTTTVEAVQSIIERFDSNWTLTQWTFGNEKFDDKTPGEPWVRLKVIHDRSVQGTISNKLNRRFDRYGEIRLDIFIPILRGRTEADLVVESFRTLFEAIQFSGIRAFEVSHREIGVFDNELMFQAECPFDYEERK